MADSKNGFWMKRSTSGSWYNVMYGTLRYGEINYDDLTKKWVFFADWNGHSWDADTLSDVKKIAKRALKDEFKKQRQN